MLSQILPEPLREIWYQLTGRANARYTYDVYDQLYWYVGYRLNLSKEMIRTLLADGPLPPKFRYRHFTVPKKDGRKRHVVEPGSDLKAIQRKILPTYLNRAAPHPATTAFQAGKSTADHAWAHAGQAVIITADIQDFFPSTPSWRVEQWWLSQQYPELQARLLTKLTTYLGSLPQGAPTSPALSNLVNYRLDTSLDNRTRQSGGTYTRYADDLVFSWPSGLRPTADFKHAVETTLRQYHYRIHPHKGWHVWSRQEEPEITGLVLTHKGEVDLPPTLKRLMKQLQRSHTPADQTRLAGYEGYQKMVQRKS